jgi:hypothetical protein
VRVCALAVVVILAVVPAAPAALAQPTSPPHPSSSSGLATAFARCANPAAAPDDGLDWVALCDLVDGMLRTADAARQTPSDPAWAAPTWEAFEALWPSEPADDLARFAKERQRKTVDAGVEAVTALTEPWRDHERADDVRRYALDLHLYARALDDAVDEGALVHRDQALRAQPILWHACAELAVLRPDRRRAAEAIIAETVHAASPTRGGSEVRYWGLKNHHLLVGPLMLAPTQAEFDAARDELSLGLWGLQANAEFKDPLTAGDLEALRRFLREHEHAAAIGTLRDGGWRRLAEVYLIGLLKAAGKVE